MRTAYAVLVSLVLTLVASNVLAATINVPSDYSTIQGAIDAASAGDTINVAAGTYTENVTIAKALTLQSTDGAASTTIAGSGGAAITVAADNVEVNGFTMTNPTGRYALTASDHSHLLITSNIVTAVGNSTDSGGYVHAIAISSSASAVDDVQIVDNVVSNIAAGGQDGAGKGYSASAISVGWSSGDEEITGLRIERNTISDVKADTTAWPVGHGAYGILLNHGTGTTGKTTGAVICSNTISDLEGLWAHAIGLEGYTPDAIVCNNDISNIVDHKSPSEPDAVGVMVEDNAAVDTVTIVSNSFVDVWLGVRNNESTAIAVSSNYWGSATPDLTTLTFGPTSIDSYYADAALTQLLFMDVFVDDGFDAATPGWSVDHFAVIQDGINAAGAGGTVNVAAGTYTENLSITKALILQGEDPATTKIRVADNIAVNITADGVTVDGFEVSRSAPADEEGDLGVRLREADNCTIKNNIIAGNSAGIILDDSGTNTIWNNTLDSNYVGLWLEGRTDGLGNSDGGLNGPFYSLSLYNSVRGNTITNTLVSPLKPDDTGSGIYLDAACDHNEFVNNTIVDNQGSGIYAWKAGNNTYTSNTITGNVGAGIHFMGSTNNVIADNPAISGNGLGLYLESGALSSTGNLITGNTLSGNTTAGIKLQDDAGGNDYVGVVSGNTISSNSILDTVGVITEASPVGVVYQAEANWWGSADQATIQSKVSANVDYSPWLGAIPGTSPMTWGTDDSIQDAVDAASSGDTINVEAGTYVENVAIDVPNLTLRSVSGRDNTIVTPVSVGLEAIGISVSANMGTVTVDGFTADGFRNAICQSHTQSEGTAFIVKNCKVIPENHGTTDSYLRNGIQVSGAGSEVIDNIVVGDPLTESWSSTAIGVLDEASGTLVQGNTVTGPAGIGVNVQSYSAVNPLENITIVSNHLDGAVNGIRLTGSASTYVVKDVDIESNTIVNSPSSAGINVQVVNLENLTVKGNEISSNNYAGVRFSSTSATLSGSIVINGNNISGNGGYGIYNGTTHTVDATPDYWGDATGPSNALVNPVALGNAVSDNVDFSPWWADAAMTILASNTVTGGAGLQDALDNANDGDVIVVTNGVSSGNISVSNNVVLTSSAGVTITMSGLTIGAEGSLSVINSTLNINGLILTGTFTLPGGWGEGAQTTVELPFEDNFNSYPDGTKLANLDSFGWGATDNVTVQSNQTHEGVGAVDVPAAGVMSNRVNGVGVSKLWADFQIKPVLRGADAPSVPSDCSQVFYFNANGYVVLHTASGWTVCSNSVSGVTVPQITNSTDWARISVFNDYTRKESAYLLNGLVLREEVPFSSESVSYFSSLMVSNDDDNAYIDDVYVGEDIPDGLRSETHSDEDNDGVDDALEIDLYGNTYANSATTVDITIAIEGAGGSVTPEGTFTVPFDSSTNVVFSADTQHYIEDVTVDGYSVGGFAGKKLRSGSCTWDHISRASTFKVIIAPYRGSMFSF